MGRDLRRYLADRLPADVPPAQRSVALEIADMAHDSTGVAYGDSVLAIVARRAGLADEKSARNALTGLAKRGIELRVAQGVSRTGQPVYAFRGRQTTYRVPDPGCPGLTVPLADAVGIQPWPFKGPRGDGPSEEKGPRDDEKGPRDEGERAIAPFLKGHGAMAPTPVPHNQDHPSARHASLLELGASADEERRVIHEIEQQARTPIHNMRALVASMHRDDKVAPILAALRAPARDRVADDWRRGLRDLPRCPHEVNGGTERHPTTGRMACPACHRQQDHAPVNLNAYRTAKAG